MIHFARCSLNAASFLEPDAGDPDSEAIRTGRTRPGNRFQGHFQGQARQLISQAIGRAILWRRDAFLHVHPNSHQPHRCG